LALHWLAANMGKLDTKPVDTVDPDRIWPLLFDLACHEPKWTGASALKADTIKPVFHPDGGIAPYWFWRRP
jgi:hypothetical protein